MAKDDKIREFLGTSRVRDGGVIYFGDDQLSWIFKDPDSGLLTIHFADGSEQTTGKTGSALYSIAAVDATDLEKSRADKTCTGVNDYVIWQAALDLGLSVLGSSGTFNLGTSGIAYKRDGQMILAQGRRRSVIKTASAITMVAAVPGSAANRSASTIRGCQLRDVTLLGHSEFGYSDYHGANQTALYGVNGRYMVDWDMVNVEVCQCYRWGVWVADTNGHDFLMNHCWINDCGNSVYAGTNHYSGGIKIGSEWAELNLTYPVVNIKSSVVEWNYDGIWVVQTAFSAIEAVVEGNYRNGIVCDYQGAGYNIGGLDIRAYAEANGNAGVGDDILIVDGNDYHINVHDSFLGSADVAYAIHATGADLSTVFINTGNNVYNNSKTNSFGKAKIGPYGPLLRGEIRTVAVPLTPGAQNSITFAWQNPFKDQDIIVTRIDTDITAGGVLNSVIKVGLADSITGTNLGSEFYTAIPGNTVALRNSYLAGDTGAQTKGLVCKMAVNGTSVDSWVCGQVTVAASTGIAGYVFITYMGR
jgi:hypothetical protein